jgi:membrane protein DedA with SNARE-associated domain
METITYWVTHYGYVGIFFLLMLGIFGVPVPDEALLMFGGYLVYRGELGLISTIGAATLGCVCGISLSYGVGRTAGFYLLTEYGRFVRVTPERMEKVRAWFDRVGRWGLLFGFFIPGVRHLTAVIAGASKLRMSSFALFAYTGGLLWSTTFVVVGYVLGKDWERVSARLHRHLVLVAGLAVLLILLYVSLMLYRRR